MLASYYLNNSRYSLEVSALATYRPPQVTTIYADDGEVPAGMESYEDVVASSDPVADAMRKGDDLADYYLRVGGVAAIWIDDAGHIGATDIATTDDDPNRIILLPSLRPFQARLSPV